MELKKGMYVRTKKGIGKIHEIRDFMGELEFHLDSNTGKIHQQKYNMYWNNVDDIIGEPTFDLIDLIEVGDFVNNKMVNRIEKNYIVVNEIWNGRELIRNDEIKSIVTKAQFNACKYVVERDTNENI